eukprot:1223051-Prorocentrum_lima.AAC.1
MLQVYSPDIPPHSPPDIPPHSPNTQQLDLNEAMSANVAGSADKNQLCLWLINDLSGELQD